MDLVQLAVVALHNTAALRSSDDSKLPVRVFDASVLAVMRSLFKSTKEYDFKLNVTASLPIASSAAGSLLANLAWSPLTTVPIEYAALAALFDETKLVRARMVITSAFGPTSTAIVTPIAIAPDYSNVGVTPTFALVLRLPEVRVLHPYLLTQGQGELVLNASIPKSRAWCITSAPSTASPIPAGWCGQWSFGNEIAGTPSINYLFTRLSFLAKFRLRA